MNESLENTPRNPDADFENKKTAFFSHIAVKAKKSLKMHKIFGLWERKGDNDNRDWGNISEHCLVAIARVDVLAEKIGLSNEEKRKLTAAGLHDFFKKSEKEMSGPTGELDWDKYEAAGRLAENHMREANIDGEIIKLVNAAGHGALFKVETLLKKERLSEEDATFLTMYYIDGYTMGTNWSKDAELGATGKINNLDRRLQAAENNSRYKKINQDGVGRFGKGETTYQAQRRVGHLVEERIAQLITSFSGVSLAPLELPTFIDREIKQRITGASN